MTVNNSSDNLLEVRDLSISIREGDASYTAVDGISYEVKKGEILGMVGESGCGKTVTNLAVMGLLPAVLSVSEGSILYDGKELTGISDAERRSLNGNEISMIYQEPLTSLNPLARIGDQVRESLEIHHPELTKEEKEKRVLQALSEVGLPNPEELIRMYPHQLSGGMRQRVCIAMATICRPRLMIADEPTTALDVTVQARVLRLLRHINRKYGMSMIFISHDLAVIRQICDRVIVMYAGKIVEEGPVEDILQNPAHEYTKGLMRSIPQFDSKGTDLPAIPGHVPSTEEYRDPCPFAPRCRLAQDICRKTAPPEILLSKEHSFYCHMSSKRQEHSILWISEIKKRSFWKSPTSTIITMTMASEFSESAGRSRCCMTSPSRFIRTSSSVWWESRAVGNQRLEMPS